MGGEAMYSNNKSFENYPDGFKEEINLSLTTLNVTVPLLDKISKCNF